MFRRLVMLGIAVVSGAASAQQVNMMAQGLPDNPVAVKRMAAEIAQQYFDSLDANHDGIVTRKEFFAPLVKQFNDADLNRNGKLTKEEVVKALEATLTAEIKRSFSEQILRNQMDQRDATPMGGGNYPRPAQASPFEYTPPDELPQLAPGAVFQAPSAGGQ